MATEIKKELDQLSVATSDSNSNILSVVSDSVSCSIGAKLGLLAEPVRPLKTEIGLLERIGSGLLDVMLSFGRFYALLMLKMYHQSNIFSCLPKFLMDMVQRWEWRLNVC